MEDLSSGCTHGGIRMNVVAGEAVLATTRAASTGWFEEVWLEFLADQKISEVLWTAVGNKGPLWDRFLQMVGGMEYRKVVLNNGW